MASRIYFRPHFFENSYSFSRITHCKIANFWIFWKSDFQTEYLKILSSDHKRAMFFGGFLGNFFRSRIFSILLPYENYSPYLKTLSCGFRPLELTFGLIFSKTLTVFPESPNEKLQIFWIFKKIDFRAEYFKNLAPGP